MLLVKKGLPEESELVMCTVTKIFPNAVFVNIEDYKKWGMIHITEISPGRIRNIRDFVREEKVVICKVLRIREDKNQVDLSLRRVNERERKTKVDEIKKEQKAEKIIENVAKKHEKEPKELFDLIAKDILKEYDNLYDAFEDVVAGSKTLEELGVEKKLAQELTTLIKQRIKPLKVEIEGVLFLQSTSPDGIEIIKNACAEGEKVKGNFNLKYKGGGKFDLTVEASTYKDAEAVMEGIVDKISAYMKENKGKIEFKRVE